MTSAVPIQPSIHPRVVSQEDTSNGMNPHACEAERLVDLARRMGVDPDEAVRLVERLTAVARLGAGVGEPKGSAVRELEGVVDGDVRIRRQDRRRRR